MLKKNNKIKTIYTDVNFYLIEILNNKNSTEITNTLLNKNNLLVRDCKTFTGMNDKFIRVAIKMPRENNELFKALEKSTMKSKLLMIQGTSSGAGKSLMVTSLCRILSNKGYKVAPFKSQNMSSFIFKINNTDKIIAQAQAIQAIGARAMS